MISSVKPGITCNVAVAIEGSVQRRCERVFDRWETVDCSASLEPTRHREVLIAGIGEMATLGGPCLCVGVRSRDDRGADAYDGRLQSRNGIPVHPAILNHAYQHQEFRHGAHGQEEQPEEHDQDSHGVSSLSARPS